MPKQLLNGDKSIIEPARDGKIGWRKVRGRIVPFSKDIGIGQYFSNLVLSRIHKQKPANTIFTGEAGISKTYCAISFARFLQPDFNIEQVAMTHAEVMRLMLKLSEGDIIVMDEPSYTIGHREWYKAQNQALVATLRSGRFKVHPLFLPVINKSLLDKVVREHLIQYQIIFRDRGEGTVYKIQPSHFSEEVYTKFLCRIYIEMLDVNKCQEPWCFKCRDFKDESCQLLRAQYEHKRQRTQDERYRQDADKAEKEEARKIPFTEWLEKAYEHFLELLYITPTGKERISTEKVCLVLGCSQSMSQRIRSALNQMTREELVEKVKEHMKIKTAP